VITPSIVEFMVRDQFGAHRGAGADQTLVVAIAMIVLVAVTRRVGAHPVD